MEFSHVSVLLHETVDGAFTDPKGVYADLTTGGGGHSLELAKRLDGGRLICFDQDREALEAAGERLKGYPVTFVRSNFSEIKSVLAELGVTALDGIIADLGVSSHQLDTAERGFSFHNDAPLDMRMSGEGLSARDVVTEYGEDEIAQGTCSVKNLRTGQQVSLSPDEAVELIRKGISELNKGSVILEK